MIPMGRSYVSQASRLKLWNRSSSDAVASKAQGKCCTVPYALPTCRFFVGQMETIHIDSASSNNGENMSLQF